MQYRLDDLNRVWIEDGLIKLNMGGYDVIRLGGLPKEDVATIYKIATEKLEAISNKSKSKQQTPTENLRYLKEMRDQGLITQAEFDSKKADLLAKM